MRGNNCWTENVFSHQSYTRCFTFTYCCRGKATFWLVLTFVLTTWKICRISFLLFFFYYVHKKRFISFICEVFGKYIYKYIHIKVLVQITNSIIFGVWQNPHPFHILKGILGGRITSAYKERWCCFCVLLYSFIFEVPQNLILFCRLFTLSLCVSQQAVTRLSRMDWLHLRMPLYMFADIYEIYIA